MQIALLLGLLLVLFLLGFAVTYSLGITAVIYKLIASHLIKAVTLTRGYGIQIDFNISEAQYLNGMEL